MLTTSRIRRVHTLSTDTIVEMDERAMSFVTRAVILKGSNRSPRSYSSITSLLFFPNYSMTYKELRKFYGLTQHQVADLVGVTQPTVHLFEKNRSKNARLSGYYSDLERRYATAERIATILLLGMISIAVTIIVTSLI